MHASCRHAAQTACVYQSARMRTLTSITLRTYIHTRALVSTAFVYTLLHLLISRRLLLISRPLLPCTRSIKSTCLRVCEISPTLIRLFRSLAGLFDKIYHARYLRVCAISARSTRAETAGALIGLFCSFAGLFSHTYSRTYAPAHTSM